MFAFFGFPGFFELLIIGAILGLVVGVPLIVILVVILLARRSTANGSNEPTARDRREQ